MPVTVIATMHTKDGLQDDVVRALTEVTEHFHAEEGCLKYTLHTSGKSRVIIVESWRDKESLAAHANGPKFAALNTRLKEMLISETEVTFAKPVPAGDSTQGTL